MLDLELELLLEITNKIFVIVMNKYTTKNIIIASLSLVLLISIYKNILNRPNFVSHSNEPKVGDKVKNNNPSCKHFESVGKVTAIKSLKGGIGKTITYRVENDGDTYCKGQLLNKTMDQLTVF